MEDIKEEKEHFFVLNVHEDRSRKPSILVAIKATDEYQARQLFPKMRPRLPIVDPKDFNILDAYNTEDFSDMLRLKCHQHLRRIQFYIERTKIDTLYPHKVDIPVDDLQYRNNDTRIMHVVDKSVHKVIEEKRAIIEDKLQKAMLTTKTSSCFYTEKEGASIIEDTIEEEKNMSFVLYNKTMGELIKFAGMVYKMTEGKKIILEFYYYENEELYRCEFGEALTMKKM